MCSDLSSAEETKEKISLDNGAAIVYVNIDTRQSLETATLSY